MLTGKQLKTIRQVAEFTGQEVADEMFMTKQTISSIETGKTTTPSSIRYYELSLSIMIDNLDDDKLRGICRELMDRYNELFEIEDDFDSNKEDRDIPWYVVTECMDESDPTCPEGSFVDFRGRNKEEAIAYAQSLKYCCPNRRIRVCNKFDL